MTAHDISFPSMGSTARIVAEGADPATARSFLAAFERRLTRFDEASELSALNRAPDHVVPASPLLRHAVRAALWAAERSGGLVDPTVLPALRAIGYDRSRHGPEISLAQALRDAPERAPAAPAPAAHWRSVCVDDPAEAVRRPPGVEIDSGGTGKGLAADLAAMTLGDAGRFAVDCGGDMRIGGPAARRRPFEVLVRHPLTGEIAHRLYVSHGAVATSGIDIHLWRDEAGEPVHHLLDPSTSRPAWTGLVGATALAPSTLEAETLAKTALLNGPACALHILARHGGLAIRDDGEVLLAGCLRPRTIVTMPREALIAGAA